jgi:hypothetical protein
VENVVTDVSAASARTQTDLIARLTAEADTLDKALDFMLDQPELAEDLRSEIALLQEAAAALTWLRPSVSRYTTTWGLSSQALVAHCVFDEPLDRVTRHPWDHWDLMGVTETAENAPEPYRDKAAAVLATFRQWLGEDFPEDLARADREMAKLTTGSISESDETSALASQAGETE